MGIEDSKTAFKKTMDFIANPSSSSAGLKGFLMLRLPWGSFAVA